ncbi:MULTISPECIES: hypothetical protein [unclassified Bradyrhizobium]|uniref:hypothetical protein n=1 Tax=unclassified Bradyrhizobium TaxID=2631580 RepID=UPI0024B074AC|nr:hypothetical protein [Bradyrhizobium sp. CB2312]WFU73318.1 hypothetical protein QA642_04405 [Bradyrhizobium sp. CB2312]
MDRLQAMELFVSTIRKSFSAAGHSAGLGVATSASSRRNSACGGSTAALGIAA